MSALKCYPLLLLILPLLCLCPQLISARRVLKGGCLNYGHSCLGAHGKRASWHSDVQLPAPTNQPQIPRPLLNVLFDALAARVPMAAFHQPKDQSNPKSTDTFLRGVRYNNGRVLNVPKRRIQNEEDSIVNVPRRRIQNEGDSIGGVIMMPDALVSILGSRMSGRDARTTSDRRLDEESEGDAAALYFLNADDYADDRIRRRSLEKAAATKESQKEGEGGAWEEKNVKDRMDHKGGEEEEEEDNNIDLPTLYANWQRR